MFDRVGGEGSGRGEVRTVGKEPDSKLWIIVVDLVRFRGQLGGLYRIYIYRYTYKISLNIYGHIFRC